jgi:signal-transduction protein with cAMP-binding, CBS, and nucleotidyltransferase domain
VKEYNYWRSIAMTCSEIFHNGENFDILAACLDLCTMPDALQQRSFCDSNWTEVGGISADRPTATCSPEHTLIEASELLQSTGRTAAVILDSEQSVLGVLTENDMLPLVIS